MPPAKKAAKKRAKPAPHKYDEGKELRRAFEHTGRVDILRRSLSPSAAEAISALVAMASAELASDRNHEAAELLRASEHLSFAALAAPPVEAPLTPELQGALEEQFEELRRRAEEHWEANQRGKLASIYNKAHEAALRSFSRRAWHQALEFARAAEALSHVTVDEAPGLSDSRKRLKAA
jgi:hypothetical protein